MDLARKHAWVPGSMHKNGKAHAVSLNKIACAVLRKHPTRVFTFKGEPISFRRARRPGGALERAGIEDFRWHDLRHTRLRGSTRSVATFLATFWLRCQIKEKARMS